MRKILVVLAYWALLPTVAYSQEATTAPEQGLPPTELTERNGSWTANAAPPDAGDFEVHVVQMGDTLWALAGQYLDNPFLWPQLWETNEHVINPHWIYPEDPILIRPIVRITEVVPPEPEPVPEPPDQVIPPDEPRPPVHLPTLTPEVLAPAEPTLAFDLPESPSAPEVKPRDLYCSGFVTTRSISSAFNIMAKAPGISPEAIFAAVGDYVYISRGANAGIAPGNLLTAIRPTREVSSKRDQVGNLGRHYNELAQLRVVTVQPEFAMARVINSCDGVIAGDTLVPFARIDFPEMPSARPFSSTLRGSGGTTGAVAIAQSVLVLIQPALGTGTSLAGISSGRLGNLSGGTSGQGEIVYIDLGDRDGVESGDLFLIYRPLNLSGRFQNIDRATRELLAGERDVIGELVVLKVEERASTALITYASDGVAPGDLIERR